MWTNLANTHFVTIHKVQEMVALRQSRESSTKHLLTKTQSLKVPFGKW